MIGIAGFRVIDQIGTGQLGPVFRAHDESHNRIVAVKLLTIDLAPHQIRQLVAEVERLVHTPLDHPAIVKPLAAGIYGSTAYFVHEYVGGESLDQALRHLPRVPTSDVFRIAVPLAGALDFAAAVNVYHGRLHLGHVFGTDGVHLTGLGIAQTLRRIGVALPTRGAYAFPADRSPSHRHGDVVAFATIVRALLDGRPLGVSPPQAVEAPLEIASGDPAVVRNAFNRVLDDREGPRFETALEFIEALMNAFYGSGPSRPQPRNDAPTHQVFPEQNRSALAGTLRRSALSPVSVALTVALTAAGTIGYVTSSPHRAESTPSRAEGQTFAHSSKDDGGLRDSKPVSTTGQARVESLHDHSGEQPGTPRFSRNDGQATATVSRRPVQRDESAPDGGSGGLFVDSQPRGATLFIDDKLVATTPAALFSITPGEHAVRLEIDGYQTWSSSVRVLSNRLNRVVATFDP